MSLKDITKFESAVSEFFGAPYGVAVDCCTHGIELALRYKASTYITCPRQTYLSIPMLAAKLNINLVWKDEKWKEYYFVTNDIVDAAVLWRKNSYITGTLMVLSFQFKKHLNLGRGGMILTDNFNTYKELSCMRYDGRDTHSDIPWAEQDIYYKGYHYYMTPETALVGLDKLNDAINSSPKQWSYEDYPDISKLKVFSNG